VSLETATRTQVTLDRMWAIEKTKPEPGLWRVQAPLPAGGPADIRIRVTAFAICGTDLHIVNWDRWAANHRSFSATSSPGSWTGSGMRLSP